MNRFVSLAAVAALGATATAATAQTAAERVLEPAPTILVERYSKITPDGLSADTLRGTEIWTTDGDLIGEVEDIYADQTVIAGIGGFLGLGERDIALPGDTVAWFEYDGPTTEFRVYIDATPEQLEALPVIYDAG